MIAQVRASGKAFQGFPWKTGSRGRGGWAKLESKAGNFLPTPSAPGERLLPANRNDFKSRAVPVEESRRSYFLAEPGTQRKSWTTAFTLSCDAVGPACLGGKIRRRGIRAGR